MRSLVLYNDRCNYLNRFPRSARVFRRGNLLLQPIGWSSTHINGLPLPLVKRSPIRSIRAHASASPV
jgi:hypothetical protein